MTRHAEVVAISSTEHLLAVSLDSCSIYVSAEPCAYCSYAIRESRIGRVIYALHAAHTGGVSKWPVLTDEDISNTIPEVFAPPPTIVGGFMADDSEAALLKWNPVVAGSIKAREIFMTGPPSNAPRPRLWLGERVLALARRFFFDWFGRGRPLSFSVSSSASLNEVNSGPPAELSQRWRRSVGDRSSRCRRPSL